MQAVVFSMRLYIIPIDSPLESLDMLLSDLAACQFSELAFKLVSIIECVPLSKLHALLFNASAQHAI
jgi:hypothetical protein